MKNLLLLILSVVSGTAALAQNNYTFSSFTQQYSELTIGSPLFSTGFFDTLAPGFNFTLDGRTNDTLKLRLKGTLSADSVTTLAERTFEPFGGEHGQGQYSYFVDGQPGSRIIKLQYKNVKFDHDLTGNDRINFQVWLFETTNIVEVHYGPSIIQNPLWDYYYGETGPYVGFKGFMLTGNPSMPTPDTTTGARLTGTPANGTVYRFQPVVTGISSFQNDLTGIKLFPNPASDKIYLPAPGRVQIFDIPGKEVFDMQTGADNSVDISTLPSATYILRAQQGRAIFIKQ